MSSEYTLSEEGSVDEQANEQREHEFEAVEEQPELRPSVDQEIQGTVDTNHPDATPEGLTLAGEERLAAREQEIERTAVRFDRRQTSDREARSRRVAARQSADRRAKSEQRAVTLDPWGEPAGVDPREQLSREELAQVNQEAARLASKLDRWSRATIGRRLAERVVDGVAMASAVIETFEELKYAPGRIIPIAAVEKVDRQEVDIEGRVATLWEPSHHRIQQVGLLEDDSGRVKFTVWRKSGQPMVREGERVRFEAVARNWYGGRVSVALTGWSRIVFPERDPWWE
jgi:hypothetical protein